MRALLIVNPNATSTTAGVRDLVVHALSSRVKLSVAHTTHRGHASELARQARLGGIGMVIVHGGDGTVNEVVNGLLGVPAPTSMQSVTIGPIPPVAVVPGGSANVFARSLGIDNHPVEATNQLIDLIKGHSRRRIGLGHCDKRWFLFNGGLGLDADVCAAIDSSRSGGGLVSPTRYVRTTVRTFFRNKSRDPRLSVELPDGRTIEGIHYAFVTNSNPWTFFDERPVHTNPGTSFDTGLGVFAMKTTAVFPTLRVARQLLVRNGQPHSKHLLRSDDVRSVRIRASEPTALQIDGDYLGMRTDVEFFSAPDALEVVAPTRS